MLRRFLRAEDERNTPPTWLKKSRWSWPNITIITIIIITTTTTIIIITTTIITIITIITTSE